MKTFEDWQKLGWRHVVWELVRYYLSLRKEGAAWLSELESKESEWIQLMKLSEGDLALLKAYLKFRETASSDGADLLRTEGEAIDFCNRSKYVFGTNKTQIEGYHQSSKALIAAVSGIAESVCKSSGLTLDPSPQGRCIWTDKSILHVTARNLDGAIPSRRNPFAVWEIKEYWGKTKGGSKMSDAVYECHLVGREIREFEERAKTQIHHFVFVDGKKQWSHRKSDLARLIDLYSQGLVNRLFIGKEVETIWKKHIEAICVSRRGS